MFDRRNYRAFAELWARVRDGDPDEIAAFGLSPRAFRWLQQGAALWEAHPDFSRPLTTAGYLPPEALLPWFSGPRLLALGEIRFLLLGVSASPLARSASDRSDPDFPNFFHTST